MFELRHGRILSYLFKINIHFPTKVNGLKMNSVSLNFSLIKKIIMKLDWFYNKKSKYSNFYTFYIILDCTINL